MPTLAVLALLLSYTILLALEPSYIALLYAAGASYPEMGRNPVTFCNILFVVRMTSGLSIAALFPRHLRGEHWRALSRRDVLLLSGQVVFLYVLTPLLFLEALRRAEVAEVVMITALFLPVGAVIAERVFGERLSRRQWIGYGIVMAGSAVAFFLDGSRGEFSSSGAWFALATMVCIVISLFLGKEITRIPVGLARLLGNLCGAVVFFFIAIVLYGPGHFMDLALPRVWQLVIIYAGIATVLEQILSFYAFMHARRQEIMTMESLYPALAIIFAVIIVGQAPDLAQAIGGVMVTAGVCVAVDWQARRGGAGRMTPASQRGEGVAAPAPDGV